MTYIVRSVLFSLLVLSAGAMALEPGTYPPTAADHMQCYDLRDKQGMGPVIANIDTRQFGLAEDCKIKHAVKFCAPASKYLEDESTYPALLLAQPQPGDTICYQVDCPDQTRREFNVGTQFDLSGHKISIGQPREICVPAVKLVNNQVPQECGFLGETHGGEVCGGPCFQEGQECRTVEINTVGDTVCECVDVTSSQPCGMDSFGQCGGDCPDPINQDCQPNIIDDVEFCSCGPKIRPCGFVDLGTCTSGVPNLDCGGECGENSECGIFRVPSGGNFPEGGTECRCSVPCHFVNVGDGMDCAGDFGCAVDNATIPPTCQPTDLKSRAKTE